MGMNFSFISQSGKRLDEKALIKMKQEKYENTPPDKEEQKHW